MTLLEWKKQSGLTYPKIYELLDFRWSQEWMVNIFTGKVLVKTTELLMRIKNLTGLSVDEIIGD